MNSRIECLSPINENVDLPSPKAAIEENSTEAFEDNSSDGLDGELDLIDSHTDHHTVASNNATERSKTPMSHATDASHASVSTASSIISGSFTSSTSHVHEEIKKVDLILPTTHNFRILSVLGKGDVGSVYLVRAYGLGERDGYYAMKVINKEDIIKRGKIQRVQTERRILATTNHPFIVHLYYAFHDKENLYYIMQYCAGGELFRYMMKQPNHCLSEDEARFCTAEILIALEYLHCMGYIYRDLKPENVLVHETGHLVLTDFDLSKYQSYSVGPDMVPQKKKSFFSRKTKGMPSLDTESHLSTQFATSFVGTVEYIAPEVLEGGYAGSVDWWTLGIFLYEMLYGCTPFKGTDARDTFSKIKRYSTTAKKTGNKKKDELDEFNLVFPETPVVSKKAKELIGRLLNKDNTKRLLNPISIKADPWFKGIQWALLRCQEPPLKPKLPDFNNLALLKVNEKLKLPSDLKWFSPSEDQSTIGVPSLSPTTLTPTSSALLTPSSSIEGINAPVHINDIKIGDMSLKDSPTPLKDSTPVKDTSCWADFNYIRIEADQHWERSASATHEVLHSYTMSFPTI